jgi:hypothetical protein
VLLPDGRLTVASIRDGAVALVGSQRSLILTMTAITVLQMKTVVELVLIAALVGGVCVLRARRNR